MSVFGRTVVVTGDVSSTEDITIEGRVEGSVTCDTGAVTVDASGAVKGDLIARDVTIIGRFDGRLIATEVVHLRPGSDVRAKVASKRFILNDGAGFDGTVEPQHVEAALRVARFQKRKAETA
jgi:cytoskeletal protein CcmA (bactofilin family)